MISLSLYRRLLQVVGLASCCRPGRRLRVARVSGSGFRVQGSWLRVQGSGFRVQGFRGFSGFEV